MRGRCLVLDLRAVDFQSSEDGFLILDRQRVERVEIVDPTLREDETAALTGLALGDDREGSCFVGVGILGAVDEAGQVARFAVDERRRPARFAGR